jgi:hypothetical protein
MRALINVIHPRVNTLKYSKFIEIMYFSNLISHSHCIGYNSMMFMAVK